jgi:hypothetical protein
VSLLKWNGRNIPSVNNINYLGVIFNKKITWQSQIEKIEAKAFSTFILTYCLFKSKRLNMNIKLTLHKALIRPCNDICLSRLGIFGRYRLNCSACKAKVHRTIGNFPRHASSREFHKAFSKPYIYDSITTLCRQHTKIIQNHGNANFRSIEQDESWHETFKRFKLGGGEEYGLSSV